MEKVELYKQSLSRFIFSELIVFLSQVAIFFVVAVLTSDFLGSEEKLLAFSKQKINDGSFGEIGLTFLAIIFVTGIFTTIGKVIDNKIIGEFIDEILYEMPKTIYVFGSAATGAMLAASLYIQMNPDANSETGAISFAVLTFLFAIMIFLYGCAFSYALKRKTHIKRKAQSQ